MFEGSGTWRKFKHPHVVISKIFPFFFSLLLTMRVINDPKTSFFDFSKLLLAGNSIKWKNSLSLSFCPDRMSGKTVCRIMAPKVSGPVPKWRFTGIFSHLCDLWFDRPIVFDLSFNKMSCAFAPILTSFNFYFRSLICF